MSYLYWEKDLKKCYRCGEITLNGIHTKDGFLCEECYIKDIIGLHP